MAVWKLLFPMLAAASALTFQEARADLPPDPCVALLERISDAADERGYVVTSTGSIVSGSGRSSSFDVECDAGYVDINLVSTDDSTVTIAFGADVTGSFALEVYGDFPLLGTVSRTGVVSAATTTSMTGFLNFSAATSAAFAAAELDLSTGTWSGSGNITSLNSTFATTLSSSTIWKDAHILAFALAGIWESGMDQYDTELDSMLDLAVALDPTLDRDVDIAEKVCWTATLTCGAALFFPPAAGTCVGATSLCLTSTACIAFDCEDDGW